MSPELRFQLDRPVYSQQRLQREFPRAEDPSPPCCPVAWKKAWGWPRWAALRGVLSRRVPCCRAMARYRPRTDVLGDLIAGLLIGIIQIPQGMAYALIASVPAVYGLYTSFFPPVVYFIFGSSRHLSMGSAFITSLFIGREINKYNCSSSAVTHPAALATHSWWSANVTTTDSPELVTSGILRQEPGTAAEDLCRMQIACAVTLLAGVIQLLMGSLNLGFIVTYMSEPVTRAFTSATSYAVLVGQLKVLFQLDMPSYAGVFSLFKTFSVLLPALPETNVASLVLSVICITVLVLTKELLEPRAKKCCKIHIPVELFLVILTTMASHFGDFHGHFNVAVVGEIPTGLPRPSVPSFSGLDLWSLLPSAFSIAIVGYAYAISFVKLTAHTEGVFPDGSQELIAHGMVNIVGPFFNCIMSSASLLRSYINMTAGATSQVSGLISCVLILFVLLFMGPLFYNLPSTVLSCIVVVTLKDLLLHVTDLPKLWRTDKIDFCTWVFSFVATLLLDADLGLLAAIAFALATNVYRAQRPKTSILQNIANTELYMDTRFYPQALREDGVRIFRFDSALSFLNAEHFVDQLYRSTGFNPRQTTKVEVVIGKASDGDRDSVSIKSTADDLSSSPMLPGRARDTFGCWATEPASGRRYVLHTVVIDCSAIAYMDSVGADTIIQVCEGYAEVGIHVCFTRCQDCVLELLDLRSLQKTATNVSFYVTNHDAILTLRSICGTEMIEHTAT